MIFHPFSTKLQQNYCVHLCIFLSLLMTNWLCELRLRSPIAKTLFSAAPIFHVFREVGNSACPAGAKFALKSGWLLGKFKGLYKHHPDTNLPQRCAWIAFPCNKKGKSADLNVAVASSGCLAVLKKIVGRPELSWWRAALSSWLVLYYSYFCLWDRNAPLGPRRHF